MSDTAVEPGQVWASRFSTATYVAVVATERTRVRLANVTVTPQGAVTMVVGRQRWASQAQLRNAYRLTTHVLESARH